MGGEEGAGGEEEEEGGEGEGDTKDTNSQLINKVRDVYSKEGGGGHQGPKLSDFQQGMECLFQRRRRSGKGKTKDENSLLNKVRVFTSNRTFFYM